MGGSANARWLCDMFRGEKKNCLEVFFFIFEKFKPRRGGLPGSKVVISRKPPIMMNVFRSESSARAMFLENCIENVQQKRVLRVPIPKKLSRSRHPCSVCSEMTLQNECGTCRMVICHRHWVGGRRIDCACKTCDLCHENVTQIRNLRCYSNTSAYDWGFTTCLQRLRSHYRALCRLCDEQLYPMYERINET